MTDVNDISHTGGAVDVNLPEPFLRIAELRTINIEWPNGTIKETLQYRLTGSEEWNDVTRSNQKRKLEWK